MSPEFDPKSPRIPDYDLLRLVGRGAYGDVWLARGVTGVFRAIKVVWRDRFSDAQPYEREFNGLKEFAAVSLVEARQLALLHVGRDNDGRFFYYVMELADDATTGREIHPDTYVPHTLKEVRSRRGRLPAAELVDLGLELSRALAGLHTRGLVHRDIKPSNVILVGGVPKLADIGLVASSTAAHTFVGTEGYISPEGPGAPPADVFSLGKLLYELATGLDRQDYPRLPPDFPILSDRKVLLELNEVIVRACDPIATNRYRDASALAEDLLLLQAGRSVRRLRLAERRLNRTVRIAAILALIAAIASIGVYLERKRAQAEFALREKAERERDDLARRSIYAATLGQAQRALEQGDYGRARSLLTKAHDMAGGDKLRGIEWSLLWARAKGDPGSVVLREKAAITRMVGDRFSRYLAVQAADDELRVVATDDGKLVKSLSGVRWLGGISRDSKWVIGEDRETGRAVRWSLSSNETLPGPILGKATRLLGLTGVDDLIMFEETSSRAIVVRGWDNAHEVQRYPILSSPNTQPWDLFRTAFSRDGQRAIFIFLQGRGTDAKWRVLAVNFETSRVIWDGEPPGLPTAVGASDSEATFMLSVGIESRLLLLREGELEWVEKRIFDQEITNMVERPHCPDAILASGRPPVVFSAKLNSTEVSERWRGHGGNLSSLSTTIDGAFLFSASTDGTVRKWPLQSSDRAGFAGWDAKGGGVLPFVGSPDGNLLLVPSDGESLALVEVGTWKILDHWAHMQAPLLWREHELWALNPDSTAVEQWELRGNAPVRVTKRLVLDPLQVLGAPTFSPDGKLLAAGTDDGRLCLWSLETGTLKFTTQVHTDAFWNLVFSDHGRSVWSVGNDSTLVATDISTGRKQREIKIDGPAPGLAVSPDGAVLALAYLDGRLELRSAEDGALRTSVLASPGLAAFVHYTADGKRLLVGGPAGTIALLTARDAESVVTLSAEASAAVYEAVFLPNNHWLGLVLSTGRIIPWPVSADEPLN